jgi:predicted Zn-dependent protease
VAAPVPTFAPEPERQPAPPPSAPGPPPAPSPAPEATSGELMSATLAELYFKQGFAEKAVEVYRQLIEREPENDRLRRRLAELQEPQLAPAQASHAGTDQASRRVALERTIAKLEGMLAAIKKG